MNAYKVAQNVRTIAEAAAELLLIKENAIQRWPQRSVYLVDEIERAELAIAHELLKQRRR